MLSLLHRGVFVTPQLTHCLLGEEVGEVVVVVGEEDMREEDGDNEGEGMEYG